MIFSVNILSWVTEPPKPTHCEYPPLLGHRLSYFLWIPYLGLQNHQSLCPVNTRRSWVINKQILWNPILGLWNNWAALFFLIFQSENIFKQGFDAFKLIFVNPILKPATLSSRNPVETLCPRKLYGPLHFAKLVCLPFESWRLFMNSVILVVQCRNQRFTWGKLNYHCPLQPFVPSCTIKYFPVVVPTC